MENKTQEIIEGNKLIAEFDGWEKSDSEVYLGYYTKYKDDDEFYPQRLELMQYHSSWDWLYEPYKKFFSLREFDTVTEGKLYDRSPYFVERLENLQRAWGSLDIIRAFDELITSINWYNKHGK